MILEEYPKHVGMSPLLNAYQAAMNVGLNVGVVEQGFNYWITKRRTGLTSASGCDQNQERSPCLRREPATSGLQFTSLTNETRSVVVQL